MYHAQRISMHNLFVVHKKGGAAILCMVSRSRYSVDQCGLELPAELTLTATSKEEATKVEKLIEGM